MTDGLLARARARNPLPPGTIAVGAGLIVLGLTSYGFLVLAGRVLGPATFAPLSALWAIVFTGGAGVFLPLEQEVGRALAERRARGEGGGPIVRRAALIAATVAGCLVLAIVAVHQLLLDELFGGEVLLLVGLAVSVLGFAPEHLLRGILSGTRRFPRYGGILAAEGLVRLGAAVVLAVVGVSTAGPYGVALGAAPLAAVLIGLYRSGHLVEAGPEAHWSELTRAVGWLLAGSVLSQVLVNGPQVAAVLLAAPGEQARAGAFIAGLVVARVPLFLFAAVQAALLPELAGLAAAGRVDRFRSALRRLLRIVAAVGVLAAAGAAVIGPWIVRLLFGPDFLLQRLDLGLLALASGLYMLALVLAQALIALGGHLRAAVGWGAGVLGLVVGTAWSAESLLLRVELGFVTGSTGALVTMTALLVTRLRVIAAVPDEPSSPTVSVEP